jgi:3-phenylpropionate/cinnamic acid dioxygenase small subunit
MDASLLLKVALLNADYSRRIDNGEFEAWPEFFADPCLYKVTTEDNHRRGWEAGAIYADSLDMLKDRITALRDANVYEGQRYRHLLGMPTLVERDASGIRAETPFAVYRIMRDGRTDLYATGRYLDRLSLASDDRLLFSERVVVCDSSIFDTLLAIPL